MKSMRLRSKIKVVTLTVLAGIIGCVGSASATTLFFDDFERDLLGNTNWVDPGSGAQIVVNPDSDAVNSSNRVLNFTSLGNGGDLFSSALIALNAGQEYKVEFDFYGKTGTAGTSGAFAGLANGVAPTPGNAGSHVWYAGTTSDYLSGGIGAITLLDTDNWFHVTYLFTSPITGAVGNSVRLMFEDFVVSGPAAGDAYFDNVKLSTVPLPAALPLYGAGIAVMGLIGWRRKRKATAAV